MCAATAVATVFGLAGDLASGGGQGNWLNWVNAILFRNLPLVFAVMAALILTRQNRNMVGWPASLGLLVAIAARDETDLDALLAELVRVVDETQTGGMSHPPVPKPIDG